MDSLEQASKPLQSETPDTKECKADTSAESKQPQDTATTLNPEETQTAISKPNIHTNHHRLLHILKHTDLSLVGSGFAFVFTLIFYIINRGARNVFGTTIKYFEHRLMKIVKMATDTSSL